MKTLYVIIGLLLLSLAGCHDIPVGYLVIEYASYEPDSMVVRRVLDTSPGELNPEFEALLNDGYPDWWITDILYIPQFLNPGPDIERDKLQLDWVSYPIGGLQGTAPIMTTITRIETTGGDVEKMRSQLKVRGNGVFELPLHFDIPVGRYQISLNFKNEGHSKNLDNCFTIIVK